MARARRRSRHNSPELVIDLPESWRIILRLTGEVETVYEPILAILVHVFACAHRKRTPQDHNRCPAMHNWPPTIRAFSVWLCQIREESYA